MSHTLLCKLELSWIHPAMTTTLGKAKMATRKFAITSQQSDPSLYTKWPSGQVAKWPSGQVAKWPSGHLIWLLWNISALEISPVITCDPGNNFNK